MTVHSLVQDVARAKMTAPRLRFAFITCLHLLSARWPFESFGWQHSVARWSTCKELFLHVLKLMSHSEGLEGLENDASTRFQLAKLLTDAGRYGSLFRRRSILTLISQVLPRKRQLTGGTSITRESARS